MSKKLAVGRRKAAMVGRQSATKRELIEPDKAGPRARGAAPKATRRSGRRERGGS
jgi:hypothetical protein